MRARCMCTHTCKLRTKRGKYMNCYISRDTQTTLLFHSDNCVEDTTDNYTLGLFSWNIQTFILVGIVYILDLAKAAQKTHLPQEASLRVRALALGSHKPTILLHFDQHRHGTENFDTLLKGEMFMLQLLVHMSLSEAWDHWSCSFVTAPHYCKWFV